jgi:hypothetical protein
MIAYGVAYTIRLIFASGCHPNIRFRSSFDGIVDRSRLTFYIKQFNICVRGYCRLLVVVLPIIVRDATVFSSRTKALCLIYVRILCASKSRLHRAYFYVLLQ